MRWAAFLMGAWTAGSIVVAVMASENFYTIDRLLASQSNSVLAGRVRDLGAPETRELLRYLSSELNRFYFQLWNLAQLLIGIMALWLIRPAAARARWTVAIMLAVVLVMAVWLAPEITAVGRSLDFVPRDPAPPQLRRFGILHAAYTTLEMAKLAAGLVVTVWITRLETKEEP